METDKPSTECTLAELARRCTFDPSFKGDWPRYFVSRFRHPNRTDVEVIALAEEYAAGIVTGRKAGKAHPDDPVWLLEEAARVEARDGKAADDKRAKSKDVNKDEVHAREMKVVKAGRAHRERNAVNRPTRRIEEHLAKYPEVQSPA